MGSGRVSLGNSHEFRDISGGESEAEEILGEAGLEADDWQRRRLGWRAGTATPFQEDFRDRHARRLFAGEHRGEVDAHIRQAGDHAAVGAEEVRVVVVVAAFVTTQLEPPDVVTQFGPRDHSDFGEVHQVAVDGGLVEALRHEFYCQFGVTDGGAGFDQFPENGNPSRRAAEARLTNPGLKIGQRLGGGKVCGHEILVVLKRGQAPDAPAAGADAIVIALD